jgi:hypothetical protein
MKRRATESVRIIANDFYLYMNRARDAGIR